MFTYQISVERCRYFKHEEDGFTRLPSHYDFQRFSDPLAFYGGLARYHVDLELRTGRYIVGVYAPPPDAPDEGFGAGHPAGTVCPSAELTVSACAYTSAAPHHTLVSGACSDRLVVLKRPVWQRFGVPVLRARLRLQPSAAVHRDAHCRRVSMKPHCSHDIRPCWSEFGLSDAGCRCSAACRRCSAMRCRGSLGTPLEMRTTLPQMAMTASSKLIDPSPAHFPD